MAINFDPSTFENTPLNHYIIFEGAVPPKLLAAIKDWLVQFKATQVTDTIWCYRVPAYGQSVAERRKSFEKVLLAAKSTVAEPEAYRVIRLSPFGQGAFTHGMPQLNMTGNIGIGFGHINPPDSDS